MQYQKQTLGEDLFKMDIYEIMFLLQFLAYFGIIGYKIFNLMTNPFISAEDKTKNIALAVLLFAGMLLAYGVGFVVSLLKVEVLVYSQLFQLQSWTLLIGVIVFISQLFFLMKDIAKSPTDDNFMSIRDR